MPHSADKSAQPLRLTSDSEKSVQPVRMATNVFPKLGALTASPLETGPARELRLYEQARAIIETLAAATSFSEVKKVADYAAALDLYAKIAHDEQLEAWVAEIRIRAQRRIGEMTLTLPKASGRNLANVGPRDHPGKREVLKAAGISKAEAHRCEQVAKVEKQFFDACIDAKRARGEPISAADIVKATVKKSTRDAVTQRAAMPNILHTGDLADLGHRGVKFGTIYADPPWPYDKHTATGAASGHYASMPVEDIAAMPVEALAEKNAHLHLWTTSSFLFEAREIMEKWGFRYRGLYVWVKPGLGLGTYWRGSAEFLLLGVRGTCPFADHGLPGWGEFSKGRHSEKPQEVRSLIERVSPGSRLELFGRAPAKGWVVWGNEIPRGDFAADVDSLLLKAGGKGRPATDFGELKAA